jgi:hypothetical protein
MKPARRARRHALPSSPPHPPRRRTAAPLVLLLAAAASGCGDSPLDPDASIAFLVAGWDASRLVVVNKANPSIAPDLIGIGVTFFLDVQPSGRYTAILTASGQPATEFGRVEVRGDMILFHREQPAPRRTDVASYRLSGDTLFLRGDTEFDFNFDGVPEPAFLESDLIRRR